MRLRLPPRSAALVLVLAAWLPSASQAGALTDLLVSKVGVSQPQANGGAGSIFKLARAQMTPQNFQKLKAAIPGMETYLGAAPAFLPGETAAPVTSGATTAAALAGAASGNPKAAAVVGLAGNGSASGALAAAATNQKLSASAVLKDTARNKASAAMGEAVPAGQGGLAALAAGALAGNSEAVPATGNASLLAEASTLLEGTQLGDKLKTAQTLGPAFEALGMQQGMVAKFLPVVLQYVKSVGGKSSSKLLTHALGL